MTKSVTMTAEDLQRSGISVVAAQTAGETVALQSEEAVRPGSGTLEDPYIDDLIFKDAEGKIHKVQSGQGFTLTPFTGEVFSGEEE